MCVLSQFISVPFALRFNEKVITCHITACRFCHLWVLQERSLLLIYACPLNHMAYMLHAPALACSVCHPDYGPSGKSVSLFRPPIGLLHKYGDGVGLVLYVHTRNVPTCQRITKRVKSTHELAFHFTGNTSGTRCT